MSGFKTAQRNTKLESCYGFFLLFSQGSPLLTSGITLNTGSSEIVSLANNNNNNRKKKNHLKGALSNSEISGILSSLSSKNLQLTDCFGEIAYNFCVLPSVFKLTQFEKEIYAKVFVTPPDNFKQNYSWK